MTYPERFPEIRLAKDKEGKLIGKIKDGRAAADGWSAILEDGRLAESFDQGLTWKLLPEEEESDCYQLMVVLKEQLLEEKNHWALFVAKSGRSGRLYQMEGDPSTRMTPRYVSDIDIMRDASFMPDKSFTVNYKINEQQREEVHAVWQYFADPMNGLIPEGLDPRKVDKNCQTVVIGMLERLNGIDKGIVSDEKLRQARRERQLFPWETNSALDSKSLQVAH